MNKIEHHSIADEFPMMDGEEYETFKSGFKNGYDPRHPITLFEGKILDGRNRQRVCLEEGLEPNFEEFHENGKTPFEFVIQENINRRHLSISKASVISVKLYDSWKKKYMVPNWRDKLTDQKDQVNKKTAIEVAKIFGIGRSSVESAVRLRKHCPEFLPRIMSGELTLSQALKRMPKVRKSPRSVEDEQAIRIMKEINPESLKMPIVFESYEKFMGEYRRALNDAGYVMQVVYASRKVYVQIVREGVNFKPWGNSRCEYDYRTAVVGSYRASLKI